MKFKISVSDLQYAMRLVRDVVPSTAVLLENTGVLIEATDNRATFTAFNSEVMVKAVVHIEGSQNGVAVVDAQSLYNAISRFQPRNAKGEGTSDISINSNPKTRKLTVSAKTRYSSGSETPHRRVFSLRNPELFPDFSIVPEGREFKLPAVKLMDGLDSVSYATASDKNTFVFTGVYVKLADSLLTLAATDGICLAEYEVAVDYTGEPIDFIIPSSLATKIAKSFFDEDILNVCVTERSLNISTPNLMLGGTLIREQYPDYKAVVPQPTEFAVLDKHVLTDNLLNLSYEASTVPDNRVSVVFENGEASLRCGQSENGGLKTDFEKNVKFDSNLKLLALSVKNVVGNDVKIGFSGEGKPLHFFSTGQLPTGAKFSCMLVPLTPQ